MSTPAMCVGGDPHQFASFYVRHRSSLVSQAARQLGDARDVEEVVQEAFLRLFLALPELETELQVLAYCRRTVDNLCIDRYRSAARRPRLVALDDLPAQAEPVDDFDDPVVRAEDAAIVRDALARLTPAHRAALIKHEMEEKSIRTVARELGVPESTVKHLLYRARRALRQVLVGSGVEPGADLEGGTAVPRQRSARVAARVGAALVLVLAIVAGLGQLSALRPSPSAPVAGAHDPGDPRPFAVPQLVPPAVAPSPSGAVPSPSAGASAPGVAAGGPAAVTPRGESSLPPAGTVDGPPDSDGEQHGPVDAAAPFVLAGNLDHVEGRLSQQQRQVLGDVAVAASTRFQATTSVGDFQLDQSLQFDTSDVRPTVTLSALRALIPTATGSESFTAATSTVTISGTSDEQLNVRVESEIRQNGFHTEAAVAAAATVVVETEFSGDLLTVASQRVSVILHDPVRECASPISVGPAQTPAATPFGRLEAAGGGAVGCAACPPSQPGCVASSAAAPSAGRLPAAGGVFTSVEPGSDPFGGWR